GALLGLAGLLSLSGRYKEALPLQEQAFALQKEVLGEKHVIWDVTVNCSFAQQP
ncbi:MAG: tetratricopeptide repeat protein, partial [Acidaminococcaceae bacterium]|nr:tetratricopeptide repeat protein [Acidaminococcaceae bacterium]